MFGIDGMVGGIDRSFHVSDHGVNPGEFFFGHAIRTTASHDAVVVTALLEHGGKAGQSIGIHQAARFKMFASLTFDFSRSEAFDNI